MTTLVARTLLVAGGFCAGIGIVSILSAEYHQQRASRDWRQLRPTVHSVQRELPSGVIARMTFERLGREVFVLSDEHPGNLKKGPVWIRMTRRFGGGGNTVVAGHRDTHFRFLKDARTGDTFTVEDGSTQLKYRITAISIVKPSDRSLLAPSASQVVTLVTCYPFHVVGRATRRMIIRAVQVSELSASGSEY